MLYLLAGKFHKTLSVFKVLLNYFLFLVLARHKSLDLVVVDVPSLFGLLPGGLLLAHCLLHAHVLLSMALGFC